MKAEDFKSMANWEKVRTLSGMIALSGDDKRDVRAMVARVALICLISRVEMGDADQEFLNQQIDKAFGEGKE